MNHALPGEQQQLVQRLTTMSVEIARIERQLTGSGRTARNRDARSLPQVVARLGAVARSLIDVLALSPDTDWSPLADDLAEAERFITPLVEELLWRLDVAADAAAELAGRDTRERESRA